MKKPDLAAPRARTLSLPGDDRDILGRARGENFPVASWLLPPAVRRHLLALYGYARLVDQAGDAAFGDRAAVLDAIEEDLRGLYAGAPPGQPLIARLGPTIEAFRIPPEPFLALIEANRRDQAVTRYETFADLLAYCSLSANPVGELVLHVFGAATPDNRALSDRICSGLQLVEHVQDVAEDFDAGRIYLPQEDLRRFGVFEFELGSREASEPFRDLVAFEVSRARTMLQQGAPLVGRLRGSPRIAVAAFVGGGLSALGAIERAGHDVLRSTPRASMPERVVETLRVLRGDLSLDPAVAPAYDRCLEITRRQARNFYFGIRLLPPDRRRALAAVYALARRIDDVGEGALPPEDKLLALEALRARLEAGDAPADDPVLVALADAAARHPIPVAAFGELIDGVEMDIRGTGYTSFIDLLVYCRRVAGAVGRLSLGVFETPDRPRAEALADDLGIALQLTNILRDVAEDLRMGRVYLPADDLARFGLGPGFEGPPQAFAELIAFEAERVESWFDSGLELLPLLDDASRACVETMTGIYRHLLRRIEADPPAVLGRRVGLPAWQKGVLALLTIGRAVR